MSTQSTKPLADGTVHSLPEDIHAVLRADRRLSELWEDITPLARNEWICWTISCAKPETRQKHLRVLSDKLHKGMRRPCCWAGCPHREKLSKKRG